MSGKVIRIGVDVDLTLVDTLTPWIQWYNQLNLAINPFFECIKEDCYLDFKGDMVALMLQRAEHKLLYSHDGWIETRSNFDPMDWWRQPDLYADLPPLASSHEFLKKLKSSFEEMGYTVEYIVISKCEPEHERSKRKWIETNFPETFVGFISTDEKHLVNMQIAIDDNPKYVIPFLENGIVPFFVPWGNYEDNNERIKQYCIDNGKLMVMKSPDSCNNHFEDAMSSFGAAFMVLKDALVNNNLQ